MTKIALAPADCARFAFFFISAAAQPRRAVFFPSAYLYEGFRRDSMTRIKKPRPRRNQGRKCVYDNRKEILFFSSPMVYEQETGGGGRVNPGAIFHSGTIYALREIAPPTRFHLAPDIGFNNRRPRAVERKSYRVSSWRLSFIMLWPESLCEKRKRIDIKFRREGGGHLDSEDESGRGFCFI